MGRTVTWKSDPWLVVDTETTGVGPDDEIVELGALVFHGGRVTDRRNVLVKPSKPIPEEATAVHGITNDIVASCPGLHDPHPLTNTSAADGLCRMAGASGVLVGYNVLTFDHPLLKRQIPAWEAASAHMAVLDPLVLVRLPVVGKFWPGKGRHKLGAVAERLGLAHPDPLFKAQTHRAAWDCVLAARVLDALSNHLPDDAREAAELCAEWQRQQEADFQAWLAKQPPKEP